MEILGLICLWKNAHLFRHNCKRVPWIAFRTRALVLFISFVLVALRSILTLALILNALSCLVNRYAIAQFSNLEL